MWRYLLLLILPAFSSCDSADRKEPAIYDGPLREVESLELYYSENELIKTKITADLVYEFQSGDREFPKGMYLEFYNEFGRLTSTLRADHAYYFKEQNQWRGRGDVEVKNIESSEQLNTEELFWKPTDKKIFTDKFVTIRQQNDVIYGTGLEANEDLSNYKIIKVSAELEIKE